MPETVIYQDERVVVTTERVTAGTVDCAISEIRTTLVNGGTGIEEKIFLGIIVAFGLGIALVGILLEDNGEFFLGVGLALVTGLILLQKGRLRLVTGAGKLTIVTDANLRYVRLVRDKIEEAMATSPSANLGT